MRSIEEIQERIYRLGEINAANSMMEIGQDLRDERQIIFNYLKVIEIVESTGNGGFTFIGENREKHKEWYLDSFNNF